MLTIEQINTESKIQVRRFVELPYRLYANCPQWVPPLFVDIELCLNRQAHPIYAHSEADFFIAVRDGRDVGRLAIFTPPYGRSDQAWFYFFECEDDAQAATALFERGFEWARIRRLNYVLGPKGFTMLGISGLLIEGFEYRQVMDMTSYNYNYYADLIERVGFEKKYDSICYHLKDNTFHLPAWVHNVADWVRQKEGLHVQQFSTMSDLLHWFPRLLKSLLHAAYIPTYDGELPLLINMLKRVVNPQLIKAIMDKEDVVGVIFAYPNLSSALHRISGRLNLEVLQKEKQRTKGIVFNGLGISRQFQKQGTNALLFSEMEKTVRQAGFQYADMLTVFETTVPMQRDLKMMGIQASQKHRVYVRHL